MEMDQNKIQAIKDYLKTQFPGAGHKTMYDHNRVGQKFIIATKDSVMVLSVSKAMIVDEDPATIISLLERKDVVDILKKHPDNVVVVRASGDIEIQSKHL